MEITYRTFSLINQKRANYGRPPLSWDENLYNLCYEHAYNSSVGRARGHDGWNGRIARIPFQWFGVAENVAFNFNINDPGTEAVNQWMRSSGHFQNIMGDYNTSALACVQSPNGSFYYFVQIFAKK